MKKIIFLLVFFLLAAGAAVLFWYWQSNQYSKDVLKLEILGPATVQAGEEVEYLVRFKNNGQVRLEQAELSFEYPLNAIPLEGNSQRVVEVIDDIYPGEERVISFKALLLGKEDEILEAKALIVYRPKNLKAPFESETSFISQIKYTPLTFEFDLPLKIEQGEKIDFSLNYFSNVDYLLKNLRVRAQYPEGFTFLSAKPSALDDTEWDLPPLAKANGGRVAVSGILEGAEGSKKMFQAQLGVIQEGRFILLKETSQSVEIVEPSLYISQLINSSQNYAARPDELLHYEVFFKNIGKSPIQRKFLFVKLESDFFDLTSLASERGDIGRGDSTVLWDWKVVQDLRFLDAGEEGKVEFWVRVKPASLVNRRTVNPVLRNTATLGGTEKTFETGLNTALALNQKVYFSEEVFGNEGPLPPQVGQTTTYTVFWQLKNYWNAAGNVKVKTILPDNVVVTGKFFPEDAKFTYDSISKEVVWNVGELSPFQGVDESGDNLPLTLAFQIALTPQAGQKGSIPWLAGLTEVTATDNFTLEAVESSAEAVDASLPDDETVSQSQAVVQ